MLEHLFGSRTRVKLLRLFLTNPERAYYVRELTRKVGERINSVRRELEHLEGINLLVSRIENQKKYYKVNQEHILFHELKALIVKSQLTLEQDLARGVRSMGKISLLLLSGIFTGIPDAQTDLLIVGKVNRARLARLMNTFKKNFDHAIRYTVMSKKEFEYRNSLTDRFLFTILENKHVTVIDALRKQK
ncbi:MAG: hypothetical protein A2898_01345 [Candidatus Kerfeldbacteria bacterium RIFCSPLOWO2_01_FULL_48_11]|uniref:HTH arsR-type domain-containing protein n=1 Tax=Candidatus Kerfeldbacteria bacterium RIFCSPLOWO2_01_FULL_48_11 TaxID=1798543 RepID=A0A1G2B016_9BACT|nr:MAG: polymerase subunit beta protein [Parcubacteria group bacterium GW2011_GWA2_48_9]KKW15234.1 MAG: polymerase subunit beta protein [Parcubacteria group bacterium GW2011_GWC2_49_9]OGY82498.1 MAG: hypothetical protein A2898_01345 [Candidatus Kerfeldbacteria bacterium RIFCSPLOWO2_01_FULL_48_11]HCJ52929.1 hypothetical protein [Candidatus Kerfeldbacteria bacterium]HCM68601.1 hypothetical protein [Candidatus Kerfeldbacteria bacterium]